VLSKWGVILNHPAILRCLLTSLAVLSLTSTALAADKPVIGPPPAWVKPHPVPAGIAAPDTAAVRVLMFDQQISFNKRGGYAVYNRTAVHIQTAQGLAAMGSVTVPWKPDTSTLTVHQLQILRGDKVIDLIGEGRQFTVLRREKGLEYAALDGTLTATMQVEDLRIGDILVSAMTIDSFDPVLRGHADAILAAGLPVTIGEQFFIAAWPADSAMRWRARHPAAKPGEQRNPPGIMFAARDVQPLAAPRDAPPRYRIGRIVELSDFASWADVAAIFVPLYAEARRLKPDSPLHAEIARIRAASPDPAKQASAALALVESQVRYVFLGMNDGALVPAAADVTWSRRFGDCKGKTALLLALLDGLGIPAEAALVSSKLGDGLPERLPGVGAFDHVIVRATIAGKTYWLDGTRLFDTDIAQVPVPDFRWALPIRAAGAGLEPVLPPPLAAPDSDAMLHLDASAGLALPAPARAEVRFIGDSAQGVNATLSNMTGEARDNAMRSFWRDRYDFITTDKMAYAYDAAAATARLTMTGSAAMDWDGSSYELDGAGLGYKADFSRDAGPDSDAPFERGFPSYSRSRETIILPAKGQGFTISGADADETLAGEQFKRTTRIVNGAVEMEASTRTLVPEVSAADARAAKARLRALDEVRVFVNAPKTYKSSKTEIDERLATPPTSLEGYLAQSKAYMDSGDNAKALAAADRALALDPKSATIIALRGIFLARLGRTAEARSALNASRAINPDETNVLILLYMVTYAEVAANGDDTTYKAAVAELSEAIVRHPQDINLLYARAAINTKHEDFAAARADTDAAAKIDPADERVQRLQAGVTTNAILGGESISDPALAIAQLTRGIALMPDAAKLYEARATAYRAANEDDNALADAAKAVSLKPDLYRAYLLRANIYKTRGDNAAVLAEARAIAAANPKDGEALVYAAGISCGMVDRATCLAAFDRAIAVEPTVYAYINRLRWRTADDVAGRRADIAAGLKLDPENADLLAADAELLFTSGDYQGAVNALASLTARQDAEGKYTPATHLKLAIAMARSGQKALADREIAGVMKHAADNASALNTICWDLAIANVALDRALAACDAALAQNPENPALLDSRGFVMLRRGDYAAAIASYDKAIAIRPKMPESLYGRGLARQKKGETAGGNADIAAARALKPDIVEQFAGYLRAAS
jgi:Flp pilus assembly protein TadD